MIGNQSAIPCYCNRELVISAGWLAGHEVQFKDTAEKQEKTRIIQCVPTKTSLLIRKYCLQSTQVIDTLMNIKSRYIL